MIARSTVRLAAGAAVLFLFLGACSDDDSAGPEVGTNIEDLTGIEDDEVATSPLLGQDVTLSGEVADVLGTNAFQIAGPGGDLLVLSTAVPAEATTGTLVQVQGTVREVLVDTFDEDFGFGYDAELLGDYEDQIAVSAEQVFVLDDEGTAAGPPATNVELDALNDSGVSGDVALVLQDNELLVTASAEDLTPLLAHAMHLRFSPGQAVTCPDIDEADLDGNDILSTVEGESAYGPIQLSLTTEGDTSAESALVLDRFPVANQDGRLEYQRTIELDQEMADMLAQAGEVAVVLHGHDLDESGVYDGEDPSSLDPGVPLEATIPVACGTSTLG